MSISALTFQTKLNKSLVYLLGVLFVFLSGCSFHQTKNNKNEENSISQENNNIIIKDSIISKSDTLNKNSKQKVDSISPKYNPRIDMQPLYGVKPNYQKNR